jgi:hypothetical protein
MTEIETAHSKGYTRHPLGLPAGSIRALLALMILAMFWTFLLLPADRAGSVPMAFYTLLGLVLHFFAAHGHTIGGQAEPSPWNLPRGLIRFAMIIVTAAVVVWAYMQDPQLLLHRLTPNASELPGWPYLLMALAGGFTLGWLLRLGPWRRSSAFQDIQAWVSLIAMIGLVAEVVLRIVIRAEIVQQLDPLIWECILVAIVAAYFGMRS